MKVVPSYTLVRAGSPSSARAFVIGRVVGQSLLRAGPQLFASIIGDWNLAGKLLLGRASRTDGQAWWCARAFLLDGQAEVPSPILLPGLFM